MAKEVTLESGSKLEITVGSFTESKALYQAMLEEGRGLKLDMSQEIDGNFWKDLFCAGLSSKKIEAALEVCMKRVTFNGARISKDTFEPEDARGDYLEVCFEVAKENVLPFTKSLFAKYGHILKTLQGKPQA